MNVYETQKFVQSNSYRCPKCPLWKSDVSSLLTSWAKSRKLGILSKDLNFMFAYWVFQDILPICVTFHVCILGFPGHFAYLHHSSLLTFWARAWKYDVLSKARTRTRRNASLLAYYTISLCFWVFILYWDEVWTLSCIFDGDWSNEAWPRPDSWKAIHYRW